MIGGPSAHPIGTRAVKLLAATLIASLAPLVVGAGAIAAPSIVTTPASLHPRAAAELTVLARDARVCVLHFSHAGKRGRDARYVAHLHGPYARFEWRTSRRPAGGRWEATVQCGASLRHPGSTGLAEVPLTLAAKGSESLVAAGSMRVTSGGGGRQSAQPTSGGQGGAGCRLGVDGGGYCIGQCVDFAWSKRTELSHLGNATDWLAGAQARGIPTGSTPVVGAIAWWSGVNRTYADSSYGHVAYVLAVGGGTVTFEEMNGPAGEDHVDTQTMRLDNFYAPQGYIYGGPAGSGPHAPPAAPPPPAEPEYPPGAPTVPGSPGPPSTGLVDDIPLPGDWTGSGLDTVGVEQPPTQPGASGVWYLRNSNTPGEPEITVNGYGGYAEIPVVGDWTGDGRDGIGVYDPPSHPGESGTWFLRNSDTPGEPEITVQYGGYGMIPVVGDWTGSGTDTIGAYLPPSHPAESGTWFLRYSNTPGETSIPPFGYGGAVSH